MGCYDIRQAPLFLTANGKRLVHLSTSHYDSIMRWSPILQPYRFTVRAIKGSENVGADFLSRYAS